jgi:primosomal protein N' (replication factor Y)
MEPDRPADGVMTAVHVVVDVPLFHLDRPFTYRVPEALRDTVRLGSRVKVPFGGRRRVDGWVVGFADELPPGARDLIRVVSPVPVFGPRDLALLRWVADRWAGTLADVLRLAVPPRVAAVEAAMDGAAASVPARRQPTRSPPWSRGAGPARSCGGPCRVRTGAPVRSPWSRRRWPPAGARW